MPTLPVTTEELLLAMVLAVVGSVVQGSIGFGLAVVSAPILLLVNPVFVPGPMLLAAMVLTVLIAYRDRREVIARDVGLGTIGRILGTIPAAYAVAVMPENGYHVLFGVLVLMGVLLSMTGWHIAPTPKNIVMAATASGIMGTLSSVGGPPMALVYQNEKGPRVRGTMSAIFIVGTFVSLAGLWWAGRFGLVELLMGLTMVPGVLVGFTLSQHTARRIDNAHTRPAVLAVSALSAVVVLLRGIL